MGQPVWRGGPTMITNNRAITVIVAPGHGTWDERVMRTLCVAREFGQVHGWLDSLPSDGDGAGSYSAASGSKCLEGIEFALLPPRRRRKLAGWLQWGWAVTAKLAQIHPDLVHLHDSAGWGLAIAQQLRRQPGMAGVKIVWDYHDWIPYDIAARVGMQSSAYRIAHRVAEAVFRWQVRSVDVMVGISDGQLRYGREVLGIEKGLYVENGRLERLPAYQPTGPMTHRLVWLGNIMSIRGVEFILEVLREVSDRFTDAQLHVWGVVREPQYMDSLLTLANELGVRDRFFFQGPYASDSDLRASVAVGTVGLAPGWADPLGTGINEIASSNKFHSYINLSVPVLLQSNLSNMASQLLSYDAGCVYDPNPKSCAEAVAQIWTSDAAWQRMSAGAARLSLQVNGEQGAHKLRKLYQDLLGPVRVSE